MHSAFFLAWSKAAQALSMHLARPTARPTMVVYGVHSEGKNGFARQANGWRLIAGASSGALPALLRNGAAGHARASGRWPCRSYAQLLPYMGRNVDMAARPAWAQAHGDKEKSRLPGLSAIRAAHRKMLGWRALRPVWRPRSELEEADCSAVLRVGNRKPARLGQAASSCSCVVTAFAAAAACAVGLGVGSPILCRVLRSVWAKGSLWPGMVSMVSCS